ncbi:MAG: NADH-quinone oxidoreductase subunit L, partial [Gammaproteobacteria bacterium]
AYYAVLTGVFITALYTFRMFFLTFHGKERIDYETWTHLHEAPAVVTIPLAVLAIPSLVIGAFLIEPMLFQGYFGDAFPVAAAHDVLAEMGQEYHGRLGFLLHALTQPVLYLACAGVLAAWLLYIRYPGLPRQIAENLKPLHRILVNKYGFDDFNQIVFAGGTRRIASLLWQVGDVQVIDGLMVNGSALAVRWLSGVVRQVQSGYLYHYAFAMIIGLLLLISIFVHRLF